MDPEGVENFAADTRVLPVHGMALLTCRGIDILIHREMQDGSISDLVMFLVTMLGGTAMSGVQHLEGSALSSS